MHDSGLELFQTQQRKMSPVLSVGLINKPIPGKKKNSVSFLGRGGKRQCGDRRYNFSDSFQYSLILIQKFPSAVEIRLDGPLAWSKEHLKEQGDAARKGCKVTYTLLII